MQQFDVAKGKSATDMRMTIDAMDLLYRGHVDGFGIMSSDSDFLPLAQRIRRRACRSTASVRPRPRWAFSRPAPASSTSVRSRCTTSTARPTRPTNSASAVDPELIDLLGSAYKASKRDDEGYAPLSELGQRATAVSSFAARNYGFTRLSDLISSIPNFEVKANPRRQPPGQTPALTTRDLDGLDKLQRHFDLVARDDWPRRRTSAFTGSM